MPSEGRHEEASPRREEPPATDRRARRPPVASSRDESPLSSPPSSTTAVSPRNAAPRGFKKFLQRNVSLRIFPQPGVRLWDRKNEWSCEYRIAVLRKSRRLVTGERKNWTTRSVFLGTKKPQGERGPDPLAASDQGQKPEEAEVADAHPSPLPPDREESAVAVAEKGPSGAWVTPVEGEARKETAGPRGGG